MKIQINCNENIDMNILAYIGYNLKDYIREYKENKDNYSCQKFINGKRKYYKKITGNWALSTDIDMTCNGKTIYFKVNDR